MRLNKGFSLLEVGVSILILSIALLTIFQSISFNNSNLDSIKKKAFARQIIINRISSYEFIDPIRDKDEERGFGQLSKFYLNVIRFILLFRNVFFSLTRNHNNFHRRKHIRPADVLLGTVNMGGLSNAESSRDSLRDAVKVAFGDIFNLRSFFDGVSVVFKKREKGLRVIILTIIACQVLCAFCGG